MEFSSNDFLKAKTRKDLIEIASNKNIEIDKVL